MFGRDKDSCVYREVNYFGLWLYLAIVLLIALYTTVGIAHIRKRQFRDVLFFLGIDVLLIVALINFFRLTFEITDNYVSFRFGFVGKEFEISRIKECSPCKISFWNYLGYGIRLGFDGSIAYNTKGGKGVKFIVNGLKRPYVVSVSDPGKVCDLIKASIR